MISTFLRVGLKKSLFARAKTQHIPSYNCALTRTHDNRTFVNPLPPPAPHQAPAPLRARCCTTTQPINTATPHVIGRLQPFYLSSSGGGSQSAELAAPRGHMSRARSLFCAQPPLITSSPLHVSKYA